MGLMKNFHALAGKQALEFNKEVANQVVSGGLLAQILATHTRQRSDCPSWK